MLARELDVPIMLLIPKQFVKNTHYSFGSYSASQFDLIDISGDPIMNYVDAVLVLYREDLYDPDSLYRNLMKIVVVKNPNGMLREVSLYFYPETMYLCDLEMRKPEDVLNNEASLADTRKHKD